MKKITDYIMVAVKGACMGAADVIPGVSGGTIAFITGIYDQLIGSINSINGTALKLFFSGKFKEFWKHINGSFLVSLFCGILVSVLSLAGLMQYLLEHHPIQTWAFFFGLIVASSIFILRGIQGWNMKSAMFPVLGVVLGIVVCTLSPTQTPDALWFIFLSGAIAICAMILPGISGSFILLILGKYKYIMGAITGLITGAAVGESLVILCVFAVGAVCGILAFSRLLHWLLARFNKETLMVLAGFIIGSLVKVWPWSNMEAIVISQFPEIADMAAATQQAIPAEVLADYIPQVDMQIGSAVLFALIGFFLVTGIEILGKAMKLRQTA
jgi:putative membrane protein